MLRLLAVALVIGLAGASVAMAATTERLSATEIDGLDFSKSKITVSAGEVTLKMRNPGSLNLEHNISLRGKGISKHGRVVAPGRTSTVTAKVRTGRYTFYCQVRDHEAEGMKGTLVVR